MHLEDDAGATAEYDSVDGIGRVTITSNGGSKGDTLAGTFDGIKLTQNACSVASRWGALASPLLRPLAHAVLSRALSLRGDVTSASMAAREAIAAVERKMPIEEGESLVRLVWVEALAATRSHDAAREAARAALLERAARIHHEAMRRQFLEHIPENARTLGLALE